MVLSHLQYIEYEVSIDSKVVCLWFNKSSVSAAELNLKLKPQANNIRITPKFTYDAITPPIDWIWSFNWLRGGFLMVLQELCFCGKNWMILQISTNPSLSLCFFYKYTDMTKTVTRWNITLFVFCLDDADTKNKKDMTLFWSLALIPTDANLVITWSRNPQSRLRSDPRKPKYVW